MEAIVCPNNTMYNIYIYYICTFIFICTLVPYGCQCRVSVLNMYKQACVCIYFSRVCVHVCIRIHAMIDDTYMTYLRLCW